MKNLKAPRGDLPGDGDGAVVVRGAKVDVLQLDHDLADDVVARVPVKAQHDEVERQAL